MSSNFEHDHEENEDYGKKFRPDREIYVVKKDGSKELFNVQKVISAVGKSAYRALTKFTREEKEQICQYVVDKVNELEVDEVPIPIMHNIVESALEQVKPVVAKSYRDYRNYKQDFVRMLDDVYKKSQSIMYIGDKENANTDSALVSTKRSLIFNQLNKELYQKFFLTTEEIQACRDGYIYVHDMSARRDTMNCCLFDVQSVLTGGFEMGNIWYNEPKTLDVAFDVIGDIVLSATFSLKPGDMLEILDHMHYLNALRQYKQPLEYPSCGSVFKRPTGHFVGPMIIKAGLQGKQIGGAQDSTKHAGFIVNKGGATATDYLNLIHLIQKTIKEKFDIDLHTEVRIIGKEK